MSTYVLRKNQRILLDEIVLDTSVTDGPVISAGNTTTQVTSDTADTKFMLACFDSGATSGDIRGLYLRLYRTADGTSQGEALRAFTTVNANVAGAHGIHASLNFLATAGASETSGLGAAGRFTLHIPDVASWAPTGTYAAVQAEIYSDGTASDPAGMTELSFFRVVNGGNATGAQDVDTDAYLFSVQGFTSGTGSMFLADVPGTLAASLRIKVGSTPYYIALYSAQND